MMISSESILYLTPYLASLAISLGIGLYTWRHRHVVGATPYALFVLFQASITFAYILELINPQLEAKIFWDSLQWIGSIGVSVAFLVFALEYTGKQPPNNLRFWGILSIIPALFLLLVASNKWHGLTLQDPQLIAGNPFSILTYDFTTAVYLITLYIYSLILASIYLLLVQLRHAHRIYRAQIGTIVIGILIPILGGILAILNITLFAQRDLTPLTFAIGNLFIAWGLFRYRLFDLLLIGRDTVIENMSEVVIVIGTKNCVVDLNPAAIQLIGQAKETIIGQTISTIFAQWPNLLKEFKETSSVHTEINVTNHTTKKVFDLRISPLYDQREQLVGRTMIMRNITVQKKAEQIQTVLLNLTQAVTTSADLQELLAYLHQQLGTLIDTRNFYVALYNATSQQYTFPFWVDEHDTDDALWQPQTLPKSYTDYVRQTGQPLLADWDTHHQLTEQGLVELIDGPSDLWLGAPLRTPNGIIGVIAVQSYADPHLYRAEDLEMLAFASDSIALAIERKMSEEALAKYRNHLEELVDIRTTQLGQTNNQLRQEIAERKRTQEIMYQNEARLRTIINNLPFDLWVCDAEGCYILQNSISMSLSGNLLGKTVDDLDISAEQLAIYKQKHQQALSGQLIQEEIQIMIDGERRFFESIQAPIQDGELGMGFVGFNIDITEHKKTEQALHAYTKELERSNRALQDFAYISSHDLQEPLRKIQTFADLLQHKYAQNLDEQGVNYLARMQRAATRSQALIQDLLIYSRVSSEKTPFTQVDLSATVADVLLDLELQIEQTEATILCASLPTIAADATQMRQLFHNLIGNALKFQQPDVAPIIEIKQLPSEDARFCRIAIIDNGIGFEEKYLDRIFTVFQRLHARDVYAGTGIGLAICRRIVEHHNGRISAKSSPRKGATFYIELPLKA